MPRYIDCPDCKGTCAVGYPCPRPCDRCRESGMVEVRTATVRFRGRHGWTTLPVEILGESATKGFYKVRWLASADGFLKGCVGRAPKKNVTLDPA